ncbi:MAG: dockerin type I domain-containing protein [Sedimentisphaerales bacterium]
MVGTKLIIVVSSDTNEHWGDGFNDGGSLAIEEEYSPYGILSAREPLVEGDWSGSHLPAAGDPAAVYDWYPIGFDLYTGSHNIEPGNWFIIDYNAIDTGDCNVGFYDHSISWDEPIYELSFSHVRTRDFNNDTIVDFHDYAIFASHWLETNCNASNECDGTDLDTNDTVNANDLMLFCQYWLERTEY